MSYSDKYGNFYGIPVNTQPGHTAGDVAVLHVEDGLAATRLDASVYPVLYIEHWDENGVTCVRRHGDLSARYEHPTGIVLAREDADKLGIEIDA